MMLTNRAGSRGKRPAAGPGGDLGFKAHADKRNDDAVVLFERKIGNKAPAVALIQQLIGETGAGYQRVYALPSD